MNTLSRREDEALLQSTKARALNECSTVVKGRSYVSFLSSDVTQFIGRLRRLRYRPHGICGLGM
jgi:hypothetical protein